MNCPKCDDSMQSVQFGEITVDRCTGCQGIWFDMLEHEHLKEIPGSEVIDIGDPAVGRQHNEQMKVDCPVCHVHMIRMVDAQQPHIWYENCPVCHGVFFDAGEFRDFKEHTLGDLFRRWQCKERK